jgi:hypothetical protein
MRAGGWVAVLALLLPVAGCGGDDEPVGTPAAGSPSPSVSQSASPTEGQGSGGGGLRKLLRASVEPLVDGSVIDFRHDVYSGEALAVETRGRAFQGTGWQATTTSPKQLDSTQAPQGDDIKGTMHVRAVDADLFLQLSTWQKQLAGCWLRTSEGQVPGGQLGMTVGVPGYVTLLGALRPAQLVSQDADKTVIGANVPLRVGLQLLTTGVLGLLQLQASQLDGATVALGVKLTDGVLTEVELRGPDLLAAVRAAGGDATPDAEATLQELRATVTYRPGPEDAPVVSAPDADLVMTNADVDAKRGCR